MDLGGIARDDVYVDMHASKGLYSLGISSASSRPPIRTIC